ncbi:MAG: hypothetical protein MJZ68_10040, partial [archaeon]|nr:hypothetical protein [archaeon]
MLSKMKYVVLGTVVLLSLVTAFAPVSDADASGSPGIVLTSTSENVTVGETFKVGVVLENNPGIWGISIDIAYSDCYKLIGVNNGTLLDITASDLARNPYRVYCENRALENMVDNGVIATLVFEAVSIPSDTPSVSSANIESYNVSGNVVAFTCSTVSIAVGEVHVHDLVHHPAKAPTYTEVGWYEYDTCTSCDYTTYREIPMLSAEGTVTITYVIDGFSMSVQVDKGSVIVPFTPTKPGYVFDHWVGYTDGMVADADRLFTASFTDAEYITVTVMYNDGSERSYLVEKGGLFTGSVPVFRYYSDSDMTKIWSSAKKLYKDTVLYAENFVQGELDSGVSWSIDISTGDMVFTGSGSMPEFENVSKLPWYSYRPYVLNVTVGEGVTNIGKYCFYNCYN